MYAVVFKNLHLRNLNTQSIQVGGDEKEIFPLLQATQVKNPPNTEFILSIHYQLNQLKWS